MNITDLDLTQANQSFYDGFNTFILSDDVKTFNKLVARTLLYDEVKTVPGDIVECGVFKGSGIYTFLKLKRLFNPNSSKQVIGFDFFQTDALLSSITVPEDRDAMTTLFHGRNFNHTDTFDEQLYSQLITHGFHKNEFQLIKGNVSTTTSEFARKNPGFKISLLYMDVDLGEPTYDVLVNLWDNVSIGGMVIFDEYGYHKWSESMGADKFAKEYGLTIENLNYMCPTACIKKTAYEEPLPEAMQQKIDGIANKLEQLHKEILNASE